MNYTLPQINAFTREEWNWPFHKFGLGREDLFTTLHGRFNLHQLPLQDPMAFHRDVCESAHCSTTLEEFYSEMEKRKTQRIEEMQDAWRSVCLSITTDYLVLACPLCYDPETDTVRTKPGTLNDSLAERWHLFNYFSRTLSFDTLIRFFDGFVRDNREEDDRHWGPHRERLRKWREKQAAKRAAATTAATEAASQSCPDASHSHPESSHTMTMPSPDTSSDTPRRSSTRRRYTAATTSSTTASSTARKRRSDEDSQGPKAKRRRESSESVGNDDDAVWIAAEHGGWGTQEPAPTTRQADGRRRTDNDLGEQRNKRVRRCSPDSEEKDELLHHHDSRREQESNWRQRRLSGIRKVHRPAHEFMDPNKAFYLPSEDDSEDVTPTRDLMPTLDPMVTQRPTAAWPAPTQDSMTTLDPKDPSNPFLAQPPMMPDPMPSRAASVDSFHTCPEAPAEREAADSAHPTGSQSSSQENTEGHAANDAANKAAYARKQKKKSRALRRQRVESRRSSEDSETPPPQRKPRQREHRERSISAPVEQLLQSQRSSRRTAGQPLFFLADDATACVASSQRRI